MEDEVCHFPKFCYCKFQERCKRKHSTQVCNSLSRCKDKDKCKKDILKIAKDLLLKMDADTKKDAPIATMFLINLMRAMR